MQSDQESSAIRIAAQRALLTLSACASASGVLAQTLPDAIAVPGETEVARIYAEGAQVYECKANATGQLVWQFREPVATLIRNSQTVGRHYAGPNWELADTSAVVGRVTGRAPGASANDIPWLRLEVTERRGSGLLAGVTTILRVNTKGGVLDGACPTAGAFQSVAYATDYIFLRRP